MSLLDKASLIVTANAYKTSKLYSIVPNTTLGDMDVVRATTATRVNASGLIESVGLNIPRIDYTNGSCPSLLVEPQRTNLVFPSATLTTQTRTVTAAPNTLSFYGTGTIVLSGVHIATLPGTGANNRVSLTFTPTAGSLILTVTGTVTNAQLELGSYPTSYIPTVASTVTRNADVISKTGISSLLNPSAGTFYFEAAALNITDFEVRTFILGNAEVNNNIVSVQFQTNGDIRFDVVSSGNTNRLTVSSINITNFNKIALSWSSLGVFGYINGIKYTVPIGAAIAIPTALSRIDYKQWYGGNNSLSKIKSTIVFKTQLTDAECIALTTL